MNEGLSWDKFMVAWQRMKPRVFYTTNDAVKRGQVLVVEAAGGFPAYVVCHPLDFDLLVANNSDVIYVPLKDLDPGDMDWAKARRVM